MFLFPHLNKINNLRGKSTRITMRIYKKRAPHCVGLNTLATANGTTAWHKNGTVLKQQRLSLAAPHKTGQDAAAAARPQHDLLFGAVPVLRVDLAPQGAGL